MHEKELLAHGYEAKRAAASKRAFANGMNLPAQRKIRRADRASFEAGIRQLRLLEREWGKWKYDNAQQAVTFEKGAVADEFNQTNDEINKATADLQAAQREALKK